MQRTVLSPATATGVGLHSGKSVRLTIHPSAANTGIVFWRSDINDRDNRIPANWRNIVDSRLGTTLGNADGVQVSTVEHILAALCGLEIDNAVIELTAQEVPVMDGSANEFISLVESVGVVEQKELRKIVEIRKEVKVTEGQSSVALRPGKEFAVFVEIDFDHPLIGHQMDSVIVTPSTFKDTVAGARTFGFYKHMEAFHKDGYALGATAKNALVFDDSAVMSSGGLRYANEPVRHKILDAIGDLSLAGGLLQGTYTGVRPSHSLHAALLRKVFEDTSAFVPKPEVI